VHDDNGIIKQSILKLLFRSLVIFVMMIEVQMGLMLRKGTTDASFILQVMKKYEVARKISYLEKTFDRVQRR